MKPPKFHGGIEPMKAEAWVLEMEKLFEVFPSIDAQKVSLAAFTLEDDARRWWMMIREGNPDLTWARFLELFYDKHFSLSVRDRKTTEFQMLIQGSKTVAEYDCAFTELVRYAPYMVDNEYRKARKFESGLRGPIQDQVNLLNMPTYAGVLDKAILAETNLNRSQSSGKNQKKRQTYDNCEEEADPTDAEEETKVDSSNSANREGGTRLTCASCGKLHFGVCLRATGACFGCGEIGHRIKDCPKVKARDDKKR
ncbi:uncharacterized protein LOC114294399 [Camellia sinensis]|uniref:uncharacterized protein LOC114294399 n=1 Tax=Camellia sinensis TaxID=4442 RepID=UPI001035F04D|nr:uncharacterized protein LOC114294399 [Camellia sinensis]